MKHVFIVLVLGFSLIGMAQQEKKFELCGKLTQECYTKCDRYNLTYWGSRYVNLVLRTNDENVRTELSRLAFRDVCIAGEQQPNHIVFDVEKVRQATQADY